MTVFKAEIQTPNRTQVLELEPGNTEAKRELIKLKKAEEKSDRQQVSPLV